MRRSWKLLTGGLAAAALAVGPATMASAAAATVVSPQNGHGWFFFNEGATGSGGYTTGPGSPPLGFGSAHLTIDSTGRESFGTAAFKGTRLDAFTTLTYSDYTPSTSTDHALVLQFDFDTDLTDADTTYQNRLSSLADGAVVHDVWHAHDALTDHWYWSSPSADATHCDQAHPCTWAQAKAIWPNGGVRSAPSVPGILLFRAGGPYAGGLDVSVDAFTVGISGNNQIFDFEPSGVLSITPATQSKGGPVSAQGPGFDPGETVSVKYKTGLSAPKAVFLCSALAQTNGTLTCSGNLPSGAQAGAKGVHTVVAKGLTSGVKLKGTVTVTK
jgi:hypothetical protein